MGLRANGCLVVVGSVLVVLLAVNPKDSEPVHRAAKSKPHTVKTSDYLRTDEVFRCGKKSHRVKCGAWLYLPRKVHRSEKGKTLPVVVMANSFGSQRDQVIPKYAEVFAQHGIATFSFDYRGFGSSDGQVRHVVDAMEQLDDWGDAIHHINQNLNSKVNASRLALWGTGFSGGLVLTAASILPSIQCAVTQVPFVGRPPLGFLLHRGVGYWAALLMDVARDMVRQWMGWPRYYSKLFGPLSDHAVIPQTSDIQEWMRSLSPRVPLGGWKNKVPASSALQLLTYQSAAKLHDITRPVMVIAASFDEYTPLDMVQRLTTKLKKSTLVTVPNSGHYDMYPGRPHHAFALKAQLGFLKSHLFPRRSGSQGDTEHNLSSWFDPTEHVTVEFSRDGFGAGP